MSSMCSPKPVAPMPEQRIDQEGGGAFAELTATVTERISVMSTQGALAIRRPARRVMHCIGSLGPGGAERQLCNLAIASQARGWDVRVLTTSELEGADAHYLPLLARGCVPARRAASAVHPLLRETVLQSSMGPLKIQELPAYLLPYTLDFVVEMLAEPPQIVHAWLDLTNIWAGLAAMLTDVPVVILSLRNMSPMRFPYLYQDWFKSWYRLLASSPRVHLVNNSVAGARDYAEWLGLPVERIKVITNGVDLESIARPSADAVHEVRNGFTGDRGLLMVGVFRLSAEKQPMLFFEVARRALEAFRDLSVVVVGTGPLRDELENAIERHGLGTRFTVLDHRCDVSALIAAADLLLMTSRYEGTPNVVLEAQALGCPVVGTRSGGTSEAILHRRTGYLLGVDDCDGLTAAVCELLGNESLRRELGAAGPAFVADRFGLPRMVDATLKSYEEYTGAGQQASANRRAQTGAGVATYAPPGGLRSAVRRYAGRLYARLDRYPGLLRVADYIRQFHLVHDPLAVPDRFQRAVCVEQTSHSVPPIMPPLRVTHYIGGLGAGGSERQLCNLVIESAARGNRTRVLTAVDPLDANGHYAEQLLNAGIPTARAGANVHPLFADAVANLPNLQLLDPMPGFLKHYMFDVLGELMMDLPHVLHCWLDLTNIWAGIAGLLADVPAIILSTRSVNPTHFPALNNPWFRPWYQLLAKSPRVHFINNSAAGALDYAKWLRLPVSRFNVIRNGVDMSALEQPTPGQRAHVRCELGVPQEAPMLLGVLRLSEEKQPMLFFAAGRAVIEHIPGAHVVLVGSGPFEKQIATAVAELGIGDRFHLLGQRRDVYQIMAVADLLLLTSRLEGTPNVLLEAQWMGCPVATTPAGGAIDALSPDETGIILDANDEARLCAQVIELLRDKARLGAMAARGPSFVAEHFSVQRMVDQTHALYRRILQLPAEHVLVAGQTPQ